MPIFYQHFDAVDLLCPTDVHNQLAPYRHGYDHYARFELSLFHDPGARGKPIEIRIL
eukprot:CAMPEP_0184401630 /NCGR_PEP_ID=MMETSP0007-20130409/79682_1 /TAXON_ID=97485 /ORGANISM="Prymnesium parvum, Strain Texoma1" /LENGTH=56 /DNA_ID=CAMNT_0026757077 /DNA_START=7 /DNA_END=173 /DNA_ORIENTATION=+